MALKPVFKKWVLFGAGNYKNLIILQASETLHWINQVNIDDTNFMHPCNWSEHMGLYLYL